MNKKYLFYSIIILLIIIILFLCWNLFLLQNANTMLENELATKNAECTELTDTNIFIHNELEEVKNDLEKVNNELEAANNELQKVNSEFESAKNELEDTSSELKEVKKENLQWSSKYNQYPTATIAWIYMTEELGWSDVVAAGIMGNMMSECGGQTLALDWDDNGSSGYGLIQWIGSRRTSIKEKYGEFPTVVEQIEFVKDELYGTNGVEQQVSDQQRELILNATSPEQCAAYFAKWFERPASSDYSRRQTNAANAYAYFCGVSEE